jgi:hypothetical protein
MVQTTEFGRGIMSQSAMAGHILCEHVPAEPLRTRDDYLKFVSQQAHAALHPAAALRDAWESRVSWDGLASLDATVEVIVHALRTVGIEVTLTEVPPSSRVDVSYRAEALPNDEADMAFI